MRAGNVVGGAVIVIGIAVAWAVVAGDTRDESYPTGRAARASRAGPYLPKYVPDSATDVRIKYNVDSMRVLGRFQASSEALKDAAGRVPSAIAGGRRATDPARALSLPSWWPTALSGDLAQRGAGGAGFELYEVASGPIVAYDRVSSVFYFWTEVQ